VKDSMRGFFRLDIPAPPFPFGPLGLRAQLVLGQRGNACAVGRVI
jgi:hypothetical protein